ncbi:MAG TPA: hypothetical protein VI456_12305 [Polyangia bacterium]
MSGARLLGLCAVALASAACTRVFEAVTPNGAEMVCTQQSTDPDCEAIQWPTPDGMHKANSDPWLVTHNQVITSMNPSVLVLNFDNGQTSTDAQTYAQQVADALAAGSEYHGYLAPAPKFLNYNITKVVQLTDSATAGTVSSYTPVTSTGAFDPTALFDDTTFPPLYGYQDGNGGFLSLCDLFEQGKVNEVWIADGGNDNPTPRAPLYAERKQQYDDNGLAIPGAFDQNIGGFIGAAGGTDALSSLNVPCKVTVRLSHLDPSSSGLPGCDVMVRGWGIEGMWSALPSGLSVDAYAFLNHDFNTKFGLAGAGWPEICGASSPCVSYPGLTHATSASMAPFSFDVKNFLQGCGNVLFPPNAVQYYDFDDSATQVDSRCAGFGLGGGPNGDAYEPYTADQTILTYDQMYTGGSPCAAGWQIYWRQSMPGYQNQAKTSDGAPMPNWWPMLFY